MAGAQRIPPFILGKIESADDPVVILHIPQRRIPSFDVNLAVQLSKEPGFRGIYLSVDRPTDILRKTLIRFEADLDKMFLVDGSGRVVSWHSKEGTADRWLFALSSSDNLRWLITILDDGVHHEDARAMIIVDNIGTLSCYASEDAIIHFLNQCRNIGGVKTVAVFDPATNQQMNENLRRKGVGEIIDMTTADF